MKNTPHTLILDLLSAAGPVLAQALNALPPHARTAVSEACDAGSWCEIRVGMMNEAASVRAVLVNLDGLAVELARVDHVPN